LENYNLLHKDSKTKAGRAALLILLKIAKLSDLYKIEVTKLKLKLK